MAGTPVTITTDTDVPTVGGDADTWGDENNAKWAAAKVDLDALALTAANSIKGNNTGSPSGVMDLTGGEVTAMLSAAVGDSGSGGTKGLVPAPATGDKRKVLTGAGSFQYGPGRKAGCVITTTSVAGSTPTLSGSWNVASISTVSVGSGIGSATLTFTDALPDTAYCVHVSTNGVATTVTVDTAYGSKTTTTVVIYWGISGGQPTELSVSIF